jgi:arginine utilization regulatory protein
VVTIFIPPLRERKEDIITLTTEFINKFNMLFQMNVKRISEEAKHLLFQHDWPGNVRELEHVIEGAMNLILDEEEIQERHLPFRFRKKYQINHSEKNLKLDPESNALPTDLQTRIDNFEIAYLKQVLQENNHNITKAAKVLGISRQSLQYRIKKFNI